MDPSRLPSHDTHHPVLDNLERTRLEHHEGPFPHPPRSPPLTGSTGAHPLEHVGTDVVDHILQQAEVVPLSRTMNRGQPYRQDSSEKSTAPVSKTSTQPNKGSSPPKTSPSSEAPPPLPSWSKDNHVESSTPGKGPNSTWQPLASKSSNQLPPAAILDSINNTGSHQQHEYEHEHEHEHEHDKRSVLPEILPGFKNRMADIHHATLKSVTEHHGTQMSGGGGGGDHSPPRRLSKSSILYESADPTQRDKSLHGDSAHQNHPPPHPHRSQVPTYRDSAPSKTLVQGGQGDRRWSHELSPEKAGLVGSVIEVAGLLKDVVLDKLQQRPPSASTTTTTSSSSSSSHESARRHHAYPRLDPEEKMEAAKVAFGGGSEETGDQTVYLEGLDEHLRHEKAARSATEVAASPSTTALEAKDLLGSAHDVAQEHRKSIFYLAANPEVRKSMLLDHPETLGYHVRDPNLAPLEESALPTPQHHSTGSHVSQQDISKTGR